MSLFRRRRDPLDPSRFPSARSWVEAMTAARLPTDEIRLRLRTELHRQDQLWGHAERAARQREFGVQTAASHQAAASRILAEVHLEDEDDLVLPPMLRPSDQLKGGTPW